MQRRTRARALTHTQLTHTAEVARCLSSQPQSVYPAVTTFMPSGLLKSHRNRAAISPSVTCRLEDAASLPRPA